MSKDDILNIDRSVDLSQPVEKLHKNEQVKAESRYLRGSLAEGLDNYITGGLDHDDTLLTKFYGIYQQDDRDIRQQRKNRKLEPDYRFMVRLRLPGGVLTVKQWLEIDRLSKLYSSSGIRITTRQTIQLHGIRKHNLRPMLQSLREVNIDTKAACGDDSRGVVCSADPNQSDVEREVYELAKQSSERLIPRTTAYNEIWYDEKDVDKNAGDPLYGPLYLPRKYKVGYAIPPLNDIDVFGQDTGFIAIVEDGKLVGFNLCVGGGMGQLDTREDSYPRLATDIGFIEKDDAPLVAEIVMGIQRDYGDRVDRHRARFKYTIDRLGLDTFKALFVERYGKELGESRPYTFDHNGDRLGWHKTSSGKWQATLYIESGRVAHQLQENIAAFLQEFSGSIRMTTNQNLQLRDIDDADKAAVEKRLAEFQLDQYINPTSQQAHTISCVALPTCGLAMAEAERYTPDFLEKLNALKAECNIAETPINLRITGCPNGCARPYLAEIALTGRATGLYNLYIGGSPRGDRLASLFASNVNEEKILDHLRELFIAFAAERLEQESFGDFTVRKALVTPTFPSFL